jgi:hypothetical protein
MQIWEAIQEYMNRVVDFTDEVNILDTNDGNISIVWNIQDKPVPTAEQLDALLPLQSPVTVFYDDNDFIWGRSTVFTNAGFEQYNHKIIHCDKAYAEHCVVIDPQYTIPLYKLVNDLPEEVTNMEDYSVDQMIWSRFMAKVRDEIRYNVRNLTKEENKVIYDASPIYKKALYGQEIEAKYAELLPQNAINLVVEGALKLLLSVLYIKEVEGRALTSAEQLEYENMLARFSNHSSIIKPFNGTNWSDYYQETILTTLDGLRNITIPERIYVTGE